MDLGPYASYRLPAAVRNAFGADTAQQLADQLGVQGTLTPGLATEAEAAYNAHRAGHPTAAHDFLTTRLGLSDDVARDVLSKLS